MNTVRIRLVRLAQLFQQHLRKDLVEVTEREVVSFFHGMRNGSIRKLNGGMFTATADYAKTFKAFWRWHVRSQKKNYDVTIPDITPEIDSTPCRKPPFVYFTIEQLRTLTDHSTRKMRVMMWFMFDSGIRPPTELSNVKGKDITKNPKGWVELQIRDETSKTFGRRVKLLLSGEMVLAWIRDEKIGPEDFVFSFNPVVVNRNLKRLGLRLFPDGKGAGLMTVGRERWDRLSMYDFRHASGCYWLPRYQSESALKYRFGWKNSDMIFYYSELLGMRDTIAPDDLLDTDARTSLERDLEKERRERAILQDELASAKAEKSAVEANSRPRAPADDLMDLLLADPSVQAAIRNKLVELRASRAPALNSFVAER